MASRFQRRRAVRWLALCTLFGGTSTLDISPSIFDVFSENPGQTVSSQLMLNNPTNLSVSMVVAVQFTSGQQISSTGGRRLRTPDGPPSQTAAPVGKFRKGLADTIVEVPTSGVPGGSKPPALTQPMLSSVKTRELQVNVASAASDVKAASAPSVVTPAKAPEGQVRCRGVNHILMRLKTDGKGDGGLEEPHDLRRRLQEDESLGVEAWRHVSTMGMDIATVKCDEGRQSAQATLKQIQERYGDALEFAEVDQVVHKIDALALPASVNDPSFGQLWGMVRSGVPAAWDRLQALQVEPQEVVVAVIDTGITVDHEDLRNIIWKNPGEIPGNGIDDDGNGFVDDVNGYDFYARSSIVIDTEGHGTHVSGTIAAQGNNGIGVVGVAGVGVNVKIMSLRFLGPDGGTISDAVRALDYAISMGVKISSNSWGGGGFSNALDTALKVAASASHLFVAAAGNEAKNLALDPAAGYPCSYQQPNILCVASTTSYDTMSSFSNFGPPWVHIGAPGSSILSTWVPAGYNRLSGTSMATPFVSGAAALVLSAFSYLTPSDVQRLVLASAESVTWLTGKVSTGGVIDVEALIMYAEAEAWLWLSLTGGTPRRSVNVSVAANSQAVVILAIGGPMVGIGSYAAQVVAKWSGGTTTVPVSFSVDRYPMLDVQRFNTSLNWSMPVGSSTWHTVPLHNIGNGTLRVSLDVLPAPFSTDMGGTLRIANGTVGNLRVICAPLQRGNYRVAVVLQTNSRLPPLEAAKANAVGRGDNVTFQLDCSAEDPPFLNMSAYSGFIVSTDDGSIVNIMNLEPSVSAQWEPLLVPGSVRAPLVAAAGNNSLGCSRHKTSLVGSIVVVMRGLCYFSLKATYAAAAGAVGILIVDSEPVTTVALMSLPTGATPPTIPAFMTSWSAGLAVLDRLNKGVSLFANFSWAPLKVYTNSPTSQGSTTRVEVRNLGRLPLSFLATTRLSFSYNQRQFYTVSTNQSYTWSTFPAGAELTGFRNTDDTLMGVDLPFDFPFWGRCIKKIVISSNGLLHFDPNFFWDADGYGLIGKTDPPNGFVAVLWDDLILNSLSRIYAAELPALADGRRVYAVQFVKMSYWDSARPETPSAATVSFEARLYSTGEIGLSYKDYSEARNWISDSRVGLEDVAGAAGIDVSTSIPFSTNKTFSVEFAPWARPTATNAGELLPGAVQEVGFAFQEAQDRMGFIEISATDDSNTWSMTRRVRLEHTVIATTTSTGSSTSTSSITTTGRTTTTTTSEFTTNPWTPLPESTTAKSLTTTALTTEAGSTTTTTTPTITTRSSTTATLTTTTSTTSFSPTTVVTSTAMTTSSSATTTLTTILVSTTSSSTTLATTTATLTTTSSTTSFSPTTVATTTAMTTSSSATATLTTILVSATSSSTTVATTTTTMVSTSTHTTLTTTTALTTEAGSTTTTTTPTTTRTRSSTTATLTTTSSTTSSTTSLSPTAVNTTTAMSTSSSATNTLTTIAVSTTSSSTTVATTTTSMVSTSTHTTLTTTTALTTEAGSTTTAATPTIPTPSSTTATLTTMSSTTSFSPTTVITTTAMTTSLSATNTLTTIPVSTTFGSTTATTTTNTMVSTSTNTVLITTTALTAEAGSTTTLTTPTIITPSSTTATLTMTSPTMSFSPTKMITTTAMTTSSTLTTILVSTTSGSTTGTTSTTTMVSTSTYTAFITTIALTTEAGLTTSTRSTSVLTTATQMTSAIGASSSSSLSTSASSWLSSSSSSWLSTSTSPVRTTSLALGVTSLAPGATTTLASGATTTTTKTTTTLAPRATTTTTTLQVSTPVVTQSIQSSVSLTGLETASGIPAAVQSAMSDALRVPAEQVIILDLVQGGRRLAGSYTVNFEVTFPVTGATSGGAAAVAFTRLQAVSQDASVFFQNLKAAIQDQGGTVPATMGVTAAMPQPVVLRQVARVASDWGQCETTFSEDSPCGQTLTGTRARTAWCADLTDTSKSVSEALCTSIAALVVSQACSTFVGTDCSHKGNTEAATKSIGASFGIMAAVIGPAVIGAAVAVVALCGCIFCRYLRSKERGTPIPAASTSGQVQADPMSPARFLRTVKPLGDMQVGSDAYAGQAAAAASLAAGTLLCGDLAGEDILSEENLWDELSPDMGLRSPCEDIRSEEISWDEQISDMGLEALDTNGFYCIPEPDLQPGRPVSTPLFMAYR